MPSTPTPTTSVIVFFGSTCSAGRAGCKARPRAKNRPRQQLGNPAARNYIERRCFFPLDRLD